MCEASFHFNLSSKDKQMLVVSGHKYYLERRKKKTTNWNCSKYQTHKFRATALTDEENFIETRGDYNHNISTGKSDARLVLKNIKDLSDSNSPTVAVATAIQPNTDDIATQIVLPNRENLSRTAQRARKQRQAVLPVSPAAKFFKKNPNFSKKFEKKTVGKMITRELFYSAILKRYLCLKNPIFGLLMDISKSPGKCLINLTVYTLVSGIAPSCVYAFLPKKNRKKLASFLRSPKNTSP